MLDLRHKFLWLELAKILDRGANSCEQANLAFALGQAAIDCRAIANLS